MNALGHIVARADGTDVTGWMRPVEDRDLSEQEADDRSVDDGTWLVCAVVPADEWDALTAEPAIDMEAVGRVRALHKARPVGAFDYCEHCEWTWPCPTIRVIEATP